MPRPRLLSAAKFVGKVCQRKPRRRLKKAAGALLSLLRANDALKPYYAQLVGMVGVADLRAVFERVLPQAGIGGAV